MSEVSERLSVEYGEERISFSVVRRNRKTMAISVLPTLDVEVVAPACKTDDEIIAKVRSRAKWIQSKRRWFSQFLPRSPARYYVGGEEHLYLGKQYRLRFVADDARGVKLKGGYFYVASPDQIDSSETMVLLDSWYRHQARRIFSRIVVSFMAKTGGSDNPPIVIKKMKTRWGSVSQSGVITLNLRLVQAPFECIEYVVMHEICHLRHFNHDKEFYVMLERFIPDWRNRKMRLESIWK
jgi:predicted metal-dependent hydrolase